MNVKPGRAMAVDQAVPRFPGAVLQAAVACSLNTRRSSSSITDLTGMPRHGTYGFLIIRHRMPSRILMRHPIMVGLQREPIMLDILLLALGLGGFALLALYAHVCDRV